MFKSIKKVLCIAILLSIFTTVNAEEKAEPAPKESKGIIWGILTYIPNRIFDVLDIARVRVRVGPGTTASVRATKLVNASVGAHLTAFVGLPGPRNKPALNLPIGLDNYTGVEASVINLSNNNNSPFSPSYGTGEVGAGFQLFLIGLDVGIDPLEIGDFVLGIFMIDLKEDDF